MPQLDTIVLSQSNWGADLSFLKKANSSRICVDRPILNKLTVKGKYPTDTMRYMLDSLRGAKMFVSIAFSPGTGISPFLKTASIELPFVPYSSRVASGLFKFKRMPFGLCNAPTTFSGLLKRVVADLQQHFCNLYVGNFFYYSANIE